MGYLRRIMLLLVLLLFGTAAPAVIHAGVPGLAEIRAMQRSYPQRISAVAVRNGEAALQMDGRWFYWANGRLLPAPVRDQWEEFVSIRFYNYTLGPPTEREITPELASRLRARMGQFTNDGGTRFNDFLDTLYQISSRAEAERRVQRVTFFGTATRVHPIVVEPLSRVEERIRQAMLVHEETRVFIRELHAVHGYNWRDIAGTPRRSYHSYGIAVDLLPRSYQRRYAYWRWAVDSGVEEWWNIPLEDRWSVPLPVLEAFEAEGFIWGGKWLSFDNIHFEYRPEIIHLAK